MLHPLRIAGLWLALSLALSCTAAERQTASSVISGVVAAAPVACAVVSATGGNGTACSEDVDAASAVAKFVEQLLASLPAASGQRRADAVVPMSFKVRHKGSTVDVTLPKYAADHVLAHYPIASAP